MTRQTSRRVHCSLAIILTCLWSVPAPVRAGEAPAANGLLAIDHLFRLATLSDPRLSPDGEWIAYTAERDDLEADEARSQVWMVPRRGGDAVPLTSAEESSSHPRWSPDGRHLAFLSARDDGPAQVWRLFRGGGEAVQITDTPQDVQAFAWSPDSTKLLLLLQDPTEAEVAAHEQGEQYEAKAPPPRVIDRKQFKQDYAGYLDRRRTHIYVLDLASKNLAQLTAGDFDDSEPAWSPDGSRVAFTSNRTDDADSNYNTDIWVVDADPAAAPAQPLQITRGPGADAGPAWSPDGRSIAHTTQTDAAAIVYATSHLAVSAADGGGTRVLTETLDRMVFQPGFAADGRHLWFLLEDGGEQSLARIRPAGGEVERLVRGERVVAQFHAGARGEVAALVSRPHLPPEVFLLDGRKLEQRTFVNREVIDGLSLGEVRKIALASRDGTPIESFVILPPGFIEGRRYPAILDIHGGPQSQYDYSFSFEGQLYAAQGYLVVRPNPRGSTGYGQAFCLAIWRDWGGPDYEDVMAAVDDVIARGWADAGRLGVTGWSYGGILTNHVITKTDRFKAAITGASEVLYVANYGHDHYQRWWTLELGPPWQPEARGIYERMSPFNRVDRVVTPTLILGGEEDWNVPIINSEQLYLALKQLGVETQLVVYPGEYHSIGRPSYERDLHQRYLDWFARWLR
ncbi:MAG TPA: S9 family peptidase [Xanthomonadales bacterium]|nr:S9 family peptidase [Xanthomonadales bacterium]